MCKYVDEKVCDLWWVYIEREKRGYKEGLL
jgi:hypothetical protein